MVHSLEVYLPIMLIVIRQRGSPQYDGVPGLSQQPIASGESFVYKWTATQYGTYWYAESGALVNFR